MRRWAVALVALTGCSTAERAPATAWLELGATRFDGAGETAVFAIPPSEADAALAVRATAQRGVCFQLSHAADARGRVVVDDRSAGAFCDDCELRTSIAAEAGVFILPARGGFSPGLGVSLGFARVDCTTLTPLTDPEDRPALTIATRPIADVPEEAAVDLRFFVAPSSVLSGDEARQKELLVHLEEELASAAIVPRLAAVHPLAGMPDELVFHTTDHRELAAALGEVAPAEGTVDVVFGGCLRYDDPIVGPPIAVHGFTPRIPGGAGPADAIFMPGLDCFAPHAGPLAITPSAQARVLAHELGHFLGLYHAVESSGLADALEDTGADNIMHFRPDQAGARGFSQLQGREMRLHPSLVPM